MGALPLHLICVHMWVKEVVSKIEKRFRGRNYNLRRNFYLAKQKYSHDALDLTLKAAIAENGREG